MSDFTPGKLYRHYRTKGLYTAVAIIKNTGDGQGDKLMALYYSFTVKELFTRPLDEFLADVPADEDPNARVPRFELLSGVKETIARLKG